MDRLAGLRLETQTAFPIGHTAPIANAVRLTLATLLLVGLLIVCGWVIAAGETKLLLIVLAAPLVAGLALSQRGATIGFLLLASMNGLPFIDTSRFTAKPIFAIAILSCLWIALDGRTNARTPLARAISACGLLLLIWWLFTVARTIIDYDVPTYDAANFGRDFGLFALLLTLLPRVRLTRRELSSMMLVLSVGVCIFAVGQIMISVGAGQPGGLIHFERTLAESGLTRVYTPMTDLIDVTLTVSIAAYLIARQRGVRLAAAPVAALLLISVVVQLTRARWIGLIVGLVLISMWLTVGNLPRVSTVLRRRLGIAIAAFLTAGTIAILVVPDVLSGGTVIHRLTSIFTDLQSGGGTIAVRESASATMKAYLGESWLAGIGLLPPSAHYFTGLPMGSIRDSDLGVLNAVMTIGVVGAALIYAPVILALIACLRRSSAAWVKPYRWLLYGGAAWLTATLVSSVTLVTLFSPTGLTLTSVVLTVLANPTVTGNFTPVTHTHRRASRSPAARVESAAFPIRAPLASRP